MADGEIRMAEATSADAPTGDPTAAAFFDVDNTIVRGASIFHPARRLHRRDLLTMRALMRVSWQAARFLAAGEGLGLVAAVEARALAFIAGHSVEEMRAVGEEVFDELLVDKIWPGTLALARMHEDAGQRVW